MQQYEYFHIIMFCITNQINVQITAKPIESSLKLSVA